MEQQIFKLKANLREIKGKKVKKLREAGKIPANLFGNDIKNLNLEIDAKEFSSLFKKIGTSSLINLTVEGENKPRRILFHEPQLHPVKGTILHADLFQVNMKEKIHTEIPLEFINEAPAVTELEGNLITNKDVLEVECLPDDLISKIEVDLSGLKTFDDKICVKDLKISEGIEIVDDPEELIISVTEPRSEEELAALEESTTTQEEEAIAELGAEEDTEETPETKESSESSDQEKN